MHRSDFTFSFPVSQLLGLAVCLDVTNSTQPPNMTFETINGPQVPSTVPSTCSIKLETEFSGGRRILRLSADDGSSSASPSTSASISPYLSPSSSMPSLISDVFLHTMPHTPNGLDNMDIIMDAPPPVGLAAQIDKTSPGMVGAFQCPAEVCLHPSNSDATHHWDCVLPSAGVWSDKPATVPDQSSFITALSDVVHSNTHTDFSSFAHGAQEFWVDGAPAWLTAMGADSIDNTSAHSLPTTDGEVSHDPVSLPTHLTDGHRSSSNSDTDPSSLIPPSPCPSDSSGEEEDHHHHHHSADEESSSGRKSSNLKGKRRRHRSRSLSEYTFHCPYPSCDRVFRSEYTCRVHTSVHKPKPKKVVSCTYPECRETFTRQHDRLRHEVSQHGKVCEWTCGVCQKFFSSQVMLDKHKCTIGNE